MKLNIRNEKFLPGIEESFVNHFLCKINFTKFVFGTKFNIDNAPAIGNPDGYSKCIRLINDINLLFTLSDSNIDWYIDFHDGRKFYNEGFINLFSIYNGVGLSDSRSQLVEKVNSHLQTKLKNKNNKFSFVTVSERDINSCENFIPKNIFIGDKIFSKSKKASYYYAFTGEIIGRIQQYRFNNDYFEIPFAINRIDDYGDKFERQFIFFPDIKFELYSGAEVFQKYNASTIIICDDFFGSSLFQVGRANLSLPPMR